MASLRGSALSHQRVFPFTCFPTILIFVTKLMASSGGKRNLTQYPVVAFPLSGVLSAGSGKGISHSLEPWLVQAGPGNRLLQRKKHGEAALEIASTGKDQAQAAEIKAG